MATKAMVGIRLEAVDGSQKISWELKSCHRMRRIQFFSIWSWFSDLPLMDLRQLSMFLKMPRLHLGAMAYDQNSSAVKMIMFYAQGLVTYIYYRIMVL